MLRGGWLDGWGSMEHDWMDGWIEFSVYCFILSGTGEAVGEGVPGGGGGG